MLHKAVVLLVLMWCFVSLAHESRAQEKDPTPRLNGLNVRVHPLSNGFVEVSREFVQGRPTASGACNYRVITKAGPNERPLDWQTVEEDLSRCQMVIVRGRMVPRQDEEGTIITIPLTQQDHRPARQNRALRLMSYSSGVRYGVKWSSSSWYPDQKIYALKNILSWNSSSGTVNDGYHNPVQELSAYVSSTSSGSDLLISVDQTYYLARQWGSASKTFLEDDSGANCGQPGLLYIDVDAMNIKGKADGSVEIETLGSRIGSCMSETVMYQESVP